jgi:hypothetical protein
MPRLGGHARFPHLVAAVDADLWARLDDWARHQEVSKSELIRDLIAQHVPDLQKLPRCAPRRVTAEEVQEGAHATDITAHHV